MDNEKSDWIRVNLFRKNHHRVGKNRKLWSELGKKSHCKEFLGELYSSNSAYAVIRSQLGYDKEHGRRKTLSQETIYSICSELAQGNTKFFNRAFTVIMALYSINRDRYLHEMEVEHRKDRLYRRKEKRKKRLHKHISGFMQMKYGRKCSVHIRSDWTRI